MNQADIFRYAVAGTMAAILIGSCVVVSAAAWWGSRKRIGEDGDG